VGAVGVAEPQLQGRAGFPFVGEPVHVVKGGGLGAAIVGEELERATGLHWGELGQSPTSSTLAPTWRARAVMWSRSLVPAREASSTMTSCPSCRDQRRYAVYSAWVRRSTCRVVTEVYALASRYVRKRMTPTVKRTARHSGGSGVFRHSSRQVSNIDPRGCISWLGRRSGERYRLSSGLGSHTAPGVTG
jgi:transposase-like protein